LFEADEEGYAERLGDPDGELEGPADSADEGLDEGGLLKLGLLEADKEGCAETLGDADGEVEGPEMAQTRGPKKADCSN
jgi:hypothetical protein